MFIEMPVPPVTAKKPQHPNYLKNFIQGFKNKRNTIQHPSFIRHAIGLGPAKPKPIYRLSIVHPVYSAPNNAPTTRHEFHN